MKASSKAQSRPSAMERWLERGFQATPRGALQFLVVAACFGLASPNQVSLVVGAVVSAAGLMLRVWTAGYGYKIGEISLGGPYQYVRHPYFLGTAMLFWGLCLAGRDPWVMGFAVVGVALSYRREIRADEERLSRSFGPVFTEYRSRVPAFIPQLWPVRIAGAPASAGFSFNYSLLTGRHREIDTVLGLACAYGLLYLCYWLTAKDLFHLGVAGAAAAFVVGRSLYFGVFRRQTI